MSDYELTGKLYRKIDVYLDGAYLHSTNWHRRCCDAKAAASLQAGLPESRFRANFA